MTTPAFLPHEDIQCLKDNVFNATEGWNIYFHNNPTIRNAFMITAALMMDILFISTFAYFIFKPAQTWRFFIAMLFFYLFRFFV